MSLQTRLAALVTAIKQETTAIRTLISGSGTGDVSGLNTTATNLVDAVNENKAAVDASLVINDTTASATEVYSSSQTEARITAEATAVADAAVVAALEGEDLSDIAAQITDIIAVNAAQDVNLASASALATIDAAVALKANTADIYTRTELGDPETDLVAIWNAA